MRGTGAFFPKGENSEFRGPTRALGLLRVGTSRGERIKKGPKDQQGFGAPVLKGTPGRTAVSWGFFYGGEGVEGWGGIFWGGFEEFQERGDEGKINLLKYYNFC